MKDRILIEAARELRRKSTEAEVVLWKHLRNRHFARFKFRRQHVVGDYILDFYCSIARLAIELDGSGHAEEDQAAYDTYRTEVLEGRGIRVMRFWNHEVLHRTEAVMEEIHLALTSALSRSSMWRS